MRQETTSYTARLLDAQGREVGCSCPCATLAEAQEAGRRYCRSNRRYATFYVHEQTRTSEVKA